MAVVETVHGQSEVTGLFQPTQVQHVQTESVSDASRLLDLDGLAVDRVESDAFGGRVCTWSRTGPPRHAPTVDSARTSAARTPDRAFLTRCAWDTRAPGTCSHRLRRAGPGAARSGRRGRRLRSDGRGAVVAARCAVRRVRVLLSWRPTDGTHLVIGEPLDGEVLTELPMLEVIPVEKLLPVLVGGELVHQDGVVAPAVPSRSPCPSPSMLRVRTIRGPSTARSTRQCERSALATRHHEEVRR